MGAVIKPKPPGSERLTIPALADRLTTLADAYKEDVAVVIEDAKKADVDTSAIRRLSSWQRKDATKRAEQEAIDHQYRFLAGEIEEAAVLPVEGELAQAVRFYADDLTVRQVAEVLKISVGKAQKLRTLARVFSVHRKMNVNTVNAVERAEEITPKATPASVLPCAEAWQQITRSAEAHSSLLVIENANENELLTHDSASELVTHREMIEGELGDPLLVIDKERGKFRDKVRTLAAGIKPVAVETVTADTRTFDEIAGEMPAHLRATRAA